MIVVCINDNNEVFEERSWDEILGVTPEEALTFNRAHTVAMSFQTVYKTDEELSAAKALVEETLKEDKRVLEHNIAVHGMVLVVTVTKEWSNIK